MWRQIWGQEVANTNISLETATVETSTKIVFSLTIFPFLNLLNSSSNIINKRFVYLYAEEQVNKVFIPTPFVSFRSGYSLTADYLGRAKVYHLTEKGSSRFWKSRYETGPYIKETSTF